MKNSSFYVIAFVGPRRKAFVIDFELTEKENAYFNPLLSSVDEVITYKKNYDVYIQLPSEIIHQGELMSSWAEGNPGWAYGPPS